MHPPVEVLEDIYFKFILTAPEECSIQSFRVLFVVEQAWWYYEDKVRLSNPEYPKYSNYKAFAKVLFEQCEALRPYLDSLEDFARQYRSLKQKIRACGAIIVDSTYKMALLVQDAKSRSWTFPKGKINGGETQAECAIREVMEETGIDIEPYIDESLKLERNIFGKDVTLFLIGGLDASTLQVRASCNDEIGGFAWHQLSDLPTNLDSVKNVFWGDDGECYNFYGVHMFMLDVRHWAKQNRRAINRQAREDTAIFKPPAESHTYFCENEQYFFSSQYENENQSSRSNKGYGKDLTYSRHDFLQNVTLSSPSPYNDSESVSVTEKKNKAKDQGSNEHSNSNVFREVDMDKESTDVKKNQEQLVENGSKKKKAKKGAKGMKVIPVSEEVEVSSLSTVKIQIHDGNEDRTVRDDDRVVTSSAKSDGLDGVARFRNLFINGAESRDLNPSLDSKSKENVGPSSDPISTMFNGSALLSLLRQEAPAVLSANGTMDSKSSLPPMKAEETRVESQCIRKDGSGNTGFSATSLSELLRRAKDRADLQRTHEFAMCDDMTNCTTMHDVASKDAVMDLSSSGSPNPHKKDRSTTPTSLVPVPSSASSSPPLSPRPPPLISRASSSSLSFSSESSNTAPFLTSIPQLEQEVWEGHTAFAEDKKKIAPPRSCYTSMSCNSNLSFVNSRKALSSSKVVPLSDFHFNLNPILSHFFTELA
mmetsp:Transcript_18503/g.33647  ORF Transcript_18503/g.33647 Transcript_18503/m.33647 type:complete len:706 (-) Transcript_18503:68-2185(-)